MGKQYIITGGNRLSGTIEIDGSKNSALALIPASLLCKDKVTLTNVPRISDIFDMLEILNELDVKYEFIDNTLTIDSSQIKNKPLINIYIKKIRASYYFMGVLLALFHNVSIATPGGCKIGDRPIDYHINGFKKLGIKIDNNEDIYNLSYSILNNTTIVLPFPSVGATINLILVSCRSENIITIANASCEPEVIQVIELLKLAGAKIKLIDNNTIIIIGNNFKKTISYKVMNDRIEAGTYCILGALLGNNLKIKGVEKAHLNSLLNIFQYIGVNYNLIDNSIIFNKSNLHNSIDITTAPYPLFPTDLQQPLCVLATQIPNISYIYEGIYLNRKAHIKELNKMGANIKTFQNKIAIYGATPLKGMLMHASDLRGGATLVIAALIANGTSIIKEINYIERGYPNIVQKLTKVGANIKLEEEL